uniref:Ubiquitin carboxyl-terminal hydrolase 7 ICP0-binding domain-containing protein n=1 Tax=Vitis vinifera TaxID=29760 RepID=A5CAP4_VITVI|nr:hypothetical protein VITISV_002293 [Vitis vinifera]
MAGFAPDEEIELYEEIKFEPCVMCEHLAKRTSFRFSQIEDGDIICFQKSAPPESEEQCRYSDVTSFLEYVQNRQQNVKKYTRYVSHMLPCRIVEIYHTCVLGGTSIYLTSC